MDREYNIRLQLFAAEKTEEATPHKRQEVRKKGQVAKSGEIGTALAIFVGFYTINVVFDSSVTRVGNLIRFFLQDVSQWNGSLEQVMSFFQIIVREGLSILLPIFASLLLVGVISQLAQVGLMFNTETIRPQFSRINPLEGFKRIFSKRAIVDLIKSSLKVMLVSYIAYNLLQEAFIWLPTISQMEMEHAVELISELVFSLAQTIGMVLLIIAAIDYFYQRREFTKNIMMSKEEIKEEYKQMEGDPQIKSRIRRKQRELASRRMMEAIPTADVVITNPTHFAIVLSYKAEAMSAPEVVAKGAGAIAVRIKEVATEHEVPMVENPPLARALYKAVEIGQQIPADLYPAVAEVLAFVYQLRRRVR